MIQGEGKSWLSDGWLGEGDLWVGVTVYLEGVPVIKPASGHVLIRNLLHSLGGPSPSIELQSIVIV